MSTPSLNELTSETKVTGDVSSFLAGRHVLLTGATGFVGKALLERLLRCCPHVASCPHAELLLRPKRSADAQQRLQQLLADPALERVRAEQPAALAKVHALPGDVGEERLGLSDADRRRVCACVSVVFHSAATVRFNEPLREAVRVNMRSTQQVLQLCGEMPQLKALVYVSTAYVNADKSFRDISEKVYHSRCDPNYVMDVCATADDTTIEALAKEWIGGHPNTYTFSKDLAEKLVQEATHIPRAMVRPSIVACTWKDPFPGWVVPHSSAVTSFSSGMMLGAARSLFIGKNGHIDVVPLDFVVDALLAAAWHAGSRLSSTEDLIVLHCTSSSCNPLTWRRLFSTIEWYCREYPLRKMMWYPGLLLTEKKWLLKMHQWFVAYPLAVFVDLYMWLSGRQQRMTQSVKKINELIEITTHFCENEWIFYNDKLLKIIHDSQDEIFKCDIVKLNWGAYIAKYVMGLRKYDFKDSIETIPSAREKLQKLYWIQCIMQLFGVTVLIMFMMLCVMFI